MTTTSLQDAAIAPLALLRWSWKISCHCALSDFQSHSLFHPHFFYIKVVIKIKRGETAKNTIPSSMQKDTNHYINEITLHMKWPADSIGLSFPFWLFFRCWKQIMGLLTAMHFDLHLFRLWFNLYSLAQVNHVTSVCINGSSSLSLVDLEHSDCNPIPSWDLRICTLGSGTCFSISSNNCFLAVGKSEDNTSPTLVPNNTYDFISGNVQTPVLLVCVQGG